MLLLCVSIDFVHEDLMLYDVICLFKTSSDTIKRKKHIAKQDKDKDKSLLYRLIENIV